MDKLKVVVTGGAGFIGSHIVEYWVNRNSEVHVIDNLRSGYLSNIEMFSNVIFHNTSVTERDLVFKIMKNVDYVFHLAAMVSVPESFEKPDLCHEINVIGLINVLEASKENKAKKVVYSSSAAVYGDNAQSPQTVGMRPEPKSPYGSTKLDGEYYLNMYNEMFNMGTVSLRYFNVFGPRQDPASQYSAAIPIFVQKALKNAPITIYGDGEQTRDFIFVKDVVNANVLAATNTTVDGIFNVATGKAISINQIVKIVLEETKSTSKINYEKERTGDIKHSLASIKETEEKLDFHPDVNLLDGLRETVKYFISKMNLN